MESDYLDVKGRRFSWNRYCIPQMCGPEPRQRASCRVPQTLCPLHSQKVSGREELGMRPVNDTGALTGREKASEWGRFGRDLLAPWNPC